MRIKYGTKITIALVALCLAIGTFYTPSVTAQDPAPQAKPKMAQRGGFMAADPRVETRKYSFKDTNEEMEYCLFVSSKVSKDKKAPLIVTLHGLGAGPAIMLNKQAVDLAEEGGYILVGPMGYNERGWYGMPMGMSGRGKMPTRKANPDGEAQPSFPKTPPQKTNPTGDNQPNAKLPSRGMGGMFGNTNDPPNLRELSEKDVMNVLDIVCKEYKVDENRMYLMGHSMGGAGTLYLGVKYASKWAALAPVAAAAFGLDPNSLAEIKNMPILFVHGDADEVVSVDNTRSWVEKAKELNMPYEYNEMPGISHGPVITACLPSIYEFFGKHSKNK